MRKIILRKLTIFLALAVLSATALAGCEQVGNGTQAPSVSQSSSTENQISLGSTDDTITDENSSSDVTSQPDSATELYVTFGDDGTPFTMHLYENDTASAIARHVGTADWRLPIYNYDGYENSDVMQYYDIPSRYEISSAPESVTSVKSGAVYCSEPNRIVLFFGDAEISAEYTQIGYFEATDEFVGAVRDNPVLEGWGNKIIQISATA